MTKNTLAGDSTFCPPYLHLSHQPGLTTHFRLGCRSVHRVVRETDPTPVSPFPSTLTGPNRPNVPPVLYSVVTDYPVLPFGVTDSLSSPSSTHFGPSPSSSHLCVLVRQGPGGPPV